MQRKRPQASDKKATGHAPRPSSSSRCHASSTLYHPKLASQTVSKRDHVVVGLSASTEDEVEDWTSDFLAHERPQTCWRRPESSGNLADVHSKRNSSSSVSSIPPPGRIGRESDGIGSNSSSNGLDEDETSLQVEVHDEKASESDEDWDAEFGFDLASDSTSFSASESMESTRKRAENGHFLLPNLQKVLDGETFADDDDEIDENEASSWQFKDKAGRRPRRLSDEPLFQPKSSSNPRLNPSSSSFSAFNGPELTLSDKFRLMDVATSSAYAVRIERYPKPSTTYSNLERDRVQFPSFSEHQYERWLADLLVADCAVIKHHMEAERERLPPPRQLKSQHFHALVSLPFGREFVTLFYQHMTQYRYYGDDKETRDLVRLFFEKVSTTGLTDAHWAQHLTSNDLEFVIQSSLEILQEAARLYGPKPVLPLATHLSLSMLSTCSSSTSSPGNKTTIEWIEHFQDMVTHCAEAFPRYSNVVALIELRYVCHHLGGFASGDYHYKWQLCNQLPAFLPLEPVMNDAAAEIVNQVLQYYGALFQHLNTSPESRSHRYQGASISLESPPLDVNASPCRDFALSSDVMCLQALILCDIQSLYDSKSALAEISLPALEELLEFEDDEATVDPLLIGFLPPNRESRSSSSSSSSPEYRETSYERPEVAKGLGGWSSSSKLLQLLRPSASTRTSALRFFYERIAATSFPLVKAKCAVVMATMHDGNARLAESLAYEALRLLERRSKDRVAPVAKQFPLRSRAQSLQTPYLSLFHNDGLLSNLGRECLETLGNLLIKNHKYRYGIRCLEAAGTLFRFLNQGAEYEKLDRLLCKLTLEADDVERALPIHEKVTYAAQQQGNITVFVYLTQEMTKLWIREGQFTRAEDWLASSCHFLRDHTTLLPPHFLATCSSYASSDGVTSRSGTLMTATSSSVSSSLSGSFHLSSSRSTSNVNEVDTWLHHDLNLHLLLRDVYRASGRTLEGLRVLEHVLNYAARFPRGKRTHLRMLVAEDALKLRLVDTCGLMFALLERDATAFCDRLQENIKGFTKPGSSSGTGAGTSSSGGGRSLGGMASEARYCFDMAFTFRYLICRIKLALQVKEPVTAYAWLSLAQVKNDRDNVRKQAQLHVLEAKIGRLLCHEKQERELETSRGRQPGLSLDDVLQPLGVSLYGLSPDEKEDLYARIQAFLTWCTDLSQAQEHVVTAYWTAFDLYRVLDDSLYQLKVLLALIGHLLAPIEHAFFALGSHKDKEELVRHFQHVCTDNSMDKTLQTLVEVQKLVRTTFKLAEQVAQPACFLQTLIYCTQTWIWLERLASYKNETHLKEATACWDQAVTLLKGVFFRRVAFYSVADDSRRQGSAGFGRDLIDEGPFKGRRYCLVPILNFSEGFIRHLEAMTLQLIFSACQLQHFDPLSPSIDELCRAHLDELLSARLCLSSIVQQLETFRGLQKGTSHSKHLASSTSTLLASKPSSVGSNNSRSSSFSAVLSVTSPPMNPTTSTPSPGVAGTKRGHKKNQSMSSISELLASNALSPYQEGAYTLPLALKSSATPRTGLASLRERPTILPASFDPPVSTRKSGERKPLSYNRERSLSAPQPHGLKSCSPSAEASNEPFSNEDQGSDSKKQAHNRPKASKFIDLSDVGALPADEDYDLRQKKEEEEEEEEGTIGWCDFDDTQSEKLWYIFNFWRDAKAKYVEGKIETSELRARNLRSLRTLLDAFDPQQIAVLYYGGDMTTEWSAASSSSLSGRVALKNPHGMLEFDVSKLNSHALIQEGSLVLSIGNEYAMKTTESDDDPVSPKLAFKVFQVCEGETKSWRKELPRPEWYIAEYERKEVQDGAIGTGILHSLRLLGAKVLLKLVGVLLLEHSVVVIGTSYPLIQQVTTSLLKLLQPFRWHHTFVPFLPVTSWRFLYDLASHHAQMERASRPKTRRSFTRLSHDWRAWSSGNSLNSDSMMMTSEVDEEEPPFVVGTTVETWQRCKAFSKQRGHTLSSCLVVVDLDDLEPLATDKVLRSAVPLPKKWRRQFLDRMDKLTRQRYKIRHKTTPRSRRSPDATFLPLETPRRESSRSGSSWIRTPGSTSAVSETERNAQMLDLGGQNERPWYDLECALAFGHGLREFYDKLVLLCAEKAQKTRKKSLSSSTSSSSSSHSKRQELKAWFSSSGHDFDTFVEQFQTTHLVETLDKEDKDTAMPSSRQASDCKSQNKQQPRFGTFKSTRRQAS